MSIQDKMLIFKQVLEIALKIINVLVSVVNTIIEKVGE